MESVVQHGRRRGSSKKAAEASNTILLPDLRQVIVLPKAELRRIQDELDRVDKEKESMIEEAKRRETLHLESVEVVKQWSNTLAGQRQKKLEAKKTREKLEEDKRKLIDEEEAKYQEQKAKEAIEKAKTQLYFQTERVKGLHRALLLSEVLKEREEQIELKKTIESSSKDREKYFMDLMQTREDEASRQEQEKTLQKKLERQAISEDLKHQIKENALVREQQKIETKKYGEEIQQLKEFYQLEQRMERERQAKQKRDLMQAHLEHLTNRDVIRMTETQKQEADEEQRKLFLSAKEKMIKLQKDRERELFREAQMRRERIMNELTVEQQEQTVDEEQKIAKVVAEQHAKQAQQQREEEEKRAAMLKSIAAYRELKRQEKEQRDKIAKQNAQDALKAKKEADRILSEKQQLKAQQIKEDIRKLQAFNATQMAERSARRQQLRREENEFEEKNAELFAEEENQFQQYSQHVINAAVEAQRNAFPLYKAAKEGIRGGFDPVSSGAKPIYLVQDRTGAQMPQYVSGITQSIKKLHEATDIQAEKMRLGFTWS